MDTITAQNQLTKLVSKMERDLAGIDLIKEAELIKQKKSKLSARTRSLVLFKLEMEASKQAQENKVAPVIEILKEDVVVEEAK